MAKKNFEYTNEELAEIALSNQDFKSPAFQFYVNDILGSNRVAMMSMRCFGTYITLLLREWNEKDCGLPTEIEKLVRISKLSRSEFDEIKDDLLEMFFEYKGRYYNRRLLEERVKQINMRVQRQNALRKRYEKPTEDVTKGTTKKNISVIEDEIENEDISFNRGIVKGESSNLKEVEEEDQYEYFRPYWNINCGLAEGKLWDTWKEWVEYKADKSEPLDRRSAHRQIKFLAKAKNGIELMERAILNGWKGFAQDENKNGSTGQKGFIQDETQEFEVI